MSSPATTPPVGSHRPDHGAAGRSRADDLRDRLAGAAGLVVLAAGVTGVVSAVVPAQRSRLRLVVELLGLPVATGAAAGSAVLGVLLVLVARGI